MPPRPTPTASCAATSNGSGTVPAGVDKIVLRWTEGGKVHALDKTTQAECKRKCQYVKTDAEKDALVANYKALLAYVKSNPRFRVVSGSIEASMAVKACASTVPELGSSCWFSFSSGHCRPWGHSRNWGYGPTGGVGLVVVVLIVLLVMGKI